MSNNFREKFNIIIKKYRKSIADVGLQDSSSAIIILLSLIQLILAIIFFILNSYYSDITNASSILMLYCIPPIFTIPLILVIEIVNSIKKKNYQNDNSVSFLEIIAIIILITYKLPAIIIYESTIQNFVIFGLLPIYLIRAFCPKYRNRRLSKSIKFLIFIFLSLSMFYMQEYYLQKELRIEVVYLSDVLLYIFPIALIKAFFLKNRNIYFITFSRIFIILILSILNLFCALMFAVNLSGEIDD